MLRYIFCCGWRDEEDSDDLELQNSFPRQTNTAQPRRSTSSSNANDTDLENGICLTPAGNAILVEEALPDDLPAKKHQGNAVLQEPTSPSSQKDKDPPLGNARMLPD